MMKKLTGRARQTASGMEPMEIWAHQPKMMFGMGKFNQAVRKGKSVDERLKNLVELKGAQMIGCEFCVDLGSQICRHCGLSDAELLALPRYRSSDVFSEREKVALDYAVAVMRTPVDVTDVLFAEMKEHFSAEQLVEITALLTLVLSTSTGSTPPSRSARPGSARGWCACRQTGRSGRRRWPVSPGWRQIKGTRQLRPDRCTNRTYSMPHRKAKTHTPSHWLREQQLITAALAGQYQAAHEGEREAELAGSGSGAR
jgi:alkylhydroperoxidase family enzyme